MPFPQMHDALKPQRKMLAVHEVLKKQWHVPRAISARSMICEWHPQSDLIPGRLMKQEVHELIVINIAIVITVYRFHQSTHLLRG